MLKFIYRRLLSGVLMLASVSIVAFGFLHIGAGNVAQRILGPEATNADLARLNEQLGINRPLVVQYLDWISHAIRFDLGSSWTFPQDVSEAIGNRLSVTFTLVTIASVLAIAVSVLLGTMAALRGGLVDRIVQLIGLVGFAIPGFVVAVFLVTFFAIKIKIFNAIGYVPPSENFGLWIKSATLPILALSLAGIASLSQQIRGSVIDAMKVDYVRTLRARGLSTKRIVFKHILRNAATPALALFGVQYVGMMGGSLILEQIFVIPGIGPLASEATMAGDVPAVMGVVMTTAVIVVIVNLAIDLLIAILNPKVRLS